jgi:hypothetical protein
MRKYTKVNNWHIDFSEEFMKELAEMSPSERKDIEWLVNGIADGSINPLTHGTVICSYCGIRELPLGVNICEQCSIELR